MQQSPPATRVRYQVLALLGVMAFIFYLDRLCIAQAATDIKASLGGIDDQQMSYIMMAFTLAYGLFEIPTGRWGDRFGSKRVLIRVVIWFSIFTILSGLCRDFWMMLVVRFLFGAGEAGAFPNSARIIMRWFPALERARARTLFISCSYFGGACAPALSALLIYYLDWRWMFVFFGVLGLAWTAWFAWRFYDDPATDPALNDGERQLLAEGRSQVEETHESIPWRQVVRHSAVWILSLIIIMSAFFSYFFFSWYPTYLKQSHALTGRESGVLASLAQLIGAVGVLIGGWAAGRIQRSESDHAFWQRFYGSSVFFLGAAFLGMSTLVENVAASTILSGLAYMAVLSHQTIWWGFASQIGGKHLGALFGLMNGAGVIGAMASQFFFGWFSRMREELGYTGMERYRPAFYVYMAVLVVAGVLYCFVNASRTISDTEPEA